jgi:Phage P22-like portal protein
MSSTIYAANQGPNDRVADNSKDQDILDRIRKRHRYHVDAWKQIRAAGASDIKALSPLGPWDDTERANRKTEGRPTIHLDQLTQYTNGFMGEVRQNPIAIDVDPGGVGASEKTAELRGDRIRRIEYDSHGTQATMTALENAVERSYGAFGVLFEYASWDSDERKIRFRRFANPDAVSWDPDCKEADWSDMQDAFVHDWMSFDEFKDKYGPDAVPTNWADGVAIAPDWIQRNSEMVQVSEYWCIEKKKREVFFLVDGRKFFRDELPEGTEVTKDALILEGLPVRIRSQRKTEQPIVMFYLTNGLVILDRTDIPGTEIPIFPMVGKERWIPETDEDAGSTTVRRHLYSYIRMGIDGQMLFDYYKTNEAEDVGLAPKPKYAGYQGQFAVPGVDYKNLNKSSASYIEFNGVVDPITGQVLPLPRWDSYQPNIQAYEVGSESARRAIQAALGSYGFTRLDDTNVKSGKAINALDRKGDLASYHLIDSYKLAVQRAGRVVNTWLDHLETDEPMDVGIRKKDGTNRLVTINAESKDDQGKPQLLRYSESEEPARHDLRISTGPSYQSQREEATDFVDTLVSSNAPFVPMIIDLAVRLKNLGPIGDQIAERLTPPQFKKDQENGQIDPQQVQEMVQQYEVALQDAMKQLEDAKKNLPKIQSDQEIAMAEIQSKERIAAEQLKVELAKVQVQTESKEAIAMLQAQMSEITRRLELMHERRMADVQHTSDRELQAGDQAHALETQQADHAQESSLQVTHEYNPETQQIEELGAAPS